MGLVNLLDNEEYKKVDFYIYYTVPRKLDSSMGKFLQTSPYYGQ